MLTSLHGEAAAAAARAAAPAARRKAKAPPANTPATAAAAKATAASDDAASDDTPLPRASAQPPSAKPAQTSTVQATPTSPAPAEAPPQAQAPPPPPPPPAISPPISPELVIQYRDGAARQQLVLHIQDCGGQEVHENASNLPRTFREPSSNLPGLRTPSSMKMHRTFLEPSSNLPRTFQDCGGRELLLPVLEPSSPPPVLTLLPSFTIPPSTRSSCRSSTC